MPLAPKWLFFGVRSLCVCIKKYGDILGVDKVPVDMKEIIAQAVKNLLVEKGVRKLTVKDIVEECRITRQTFYYHFEDIPDLFRWMFERGTAMLMLEAKSLKNGEERLRCLFVMAINTLPYVKKGIKSNYGEELEQFMTQYIQLLFEKVCDEEGLYQNYGRFEVNLILRYHSQAVLGLLRNWTDTDTKNLDQIVNVVYRLMTEGISPTQKI